MPERMRKPLTAWATSGAAVVAVFATACGTATDGSSGIGDANTIAVPAIAEDASPNEIRDGAQELADAWYGSLTERQAAEVLVAHELNGARADCMADHGFNWSWAQGLMPAVAEDPLAVTGWFAQPHALLWSPVAQAWAPFHRSEQKMNSDDGTSAEEQAAMTQCLKSTPAGSDATVDALRTPKGLSEVAAAWGDALAAAGDKYGPRSTYDQCMSAQDLQILTGKPYTGRQIFDAMNKALPDLADIPVDGASTNPTWDQYLALEQSVASADWKCRSDVYAEGIQSLVPVLNQFAAEYADQIAVLRAYWRGVQIEAEKLGWDPVTNEVG